MKKIYILTAVFALLTLSLNAQMLPYKADGKESVYLDRGKQASASGLFRAPAKINAADGEFLVGPYTTDYFSATGKGLYDLIQSQGRVDITAILDRSEIEQYIGQEIVGYRFATTGTVSCYSFLISTEGPNHYVSDINVFNIQSSGNYVDVSGTQWHEYYLDQPVTFEVPDTAITVWIGYKYFQESSSSAGNTYTMTPILVNPNSTSHETYAYSYGTSQFYDVTSTLGGDLAAQLIFKAPSTDPKITASPTSVSMNTAPGEATTETVTVTGANLTDGITYTLSGTDASLFSVSPASLGTSGGTLTITYSPTADGTHTATLTLSSTGAQDVVITLNGTCSSDITICDGTNTNGYLPIYGIYCDDYQINQMIYPEELLTNLVGKILTSMTFYATAPLDANLSTVDWDVKLGTTTQASFASSLGSITRLVPDDVTTVAQGYVITSGINTMTITFDEPFTYNGGNLLIDFQSNAEGQYKATNFYGVNQSTYTGYNSYRSNTATPNQNGHYSSGGVRQFLPKVTFTVEANNKTATPTISYVVNGDNVVITATGNGTVTLNVPGYESATGNGSASITVPRTDTSYSVTATATAQESDKDVSDPATETIIIPFLQTATPTISVSEPDANGNVTVTATGNGTVTLTIGDQTVTGNGTASITLTPRVNSYTVTATATAKEDGKAASDPATREVTVTPAGGEWLEMYGTYNNPNDLLSLQSLEVDEDGEHLEIMMIDQFLASTLSNEHPNGYTYIMKETVNNEEKSSNSVNIPVYKTNSSIQGLYTKKQVDDDIDMHLTANAINSEMDYNVHPDRNTLYYSLYRGDMNANYPVIDVPHRISQLQKFDELVDGNVQYFMFENHTDGITPRYDHLGTQIAERLDTSYVQGSYNDELSYVPVIWTYGLYTARGDGKNNSYGSDIKREKLGDVTVKITGSKSGANNVEDTGAGWEGLFKVGNEWYCIYTPIIDITGIVPCDGENVQNDRDVNSYVPYMYRAWCLYPGARNFKHVAQTNSQGQTVQVLADDGELTIPYLLGTNQVEASHTQIGQAWQNGQPKLQWAFGVPVSEDPANVLIAVRFYYKKNVNEIAQPNSLRGGNRDGEVDENSEEYYIVQVEGTAEDIETSINEFYAGKAIVGVTYVNSLGMKSDKPFDGLNIVVTRYSDGTTSTTKVIR